MSKKKNTLNDLEEFLKMQASSLVTPPALTEKVKEVPAAPAPATIPTPAPAPAPRALPADAEVIEAMRHVASTDKKKFYDLLIRITENLPNRTKEDVLLINSALYLKGGTNWKETVSDYWKKVV
ncbi:MAG: hypothetical protein ACOYXA_01720 [Bacteroidota bacterium]